MPRDRVPIVFVLSDGRGETASRVVQAAALQFREQDYRIVRHADARSPEQIRAAVRLAAETGSVIFYTLVSEDTRREMVTAAAQRAVPVVDVLGPAFSALHDLFRRERESTPGLLYALERERVDRMDAVEYTLKHDDGQRPHELADADVVLVGVSRASKSSTCFFLAYQGIRAANVPLVPGVAPPQDLLHLSPERVIGLRINASRLRIVRAARAAAISLDGSAAYLDEQGIAREVIEAGRVMERHGWRSIDVSYLAIEEISRQVLSLRGLRPRVS